jgi:class 3 adenylate cyclase
MADVNPNKLSPGNLREIDTAVLQAAVVRSSMISFIYAAVFMTYSFTSMSFIKAFDPSVTLLSNTWPRVIFNVLPLILMGIYFRNGTTHTERKMWIWAVGLPFIFLAACLTNVWPIMWAGSGDIYFYIHAANTFIITTAIIVVSPPLRILVTQVVTFVLVIIAPIVYFFLTTGNKNLLNFALGDYVIAIPVVINLGYMIYKLRRKIAIFEFYMKKQAASFLGSAVTDAIFNGKSHLFESRTVNAVVMQIDIRGFTNFYNSVGPEVARPFMQEYHAIVSRVVGRVGGYWHKSVGDAQLVTFGAIEDVDMTDIPGIEFELMTAAERRKEHHFNCALSAAQIINSEFESAMTRHGFGGKMCLGIAITYGDLQVRIQGDEDHKRELDIDGQAAIRCSRLEEYTKVVISRCELSGSVLIVSPELSHLATDKAFLDWDTTTADLAVRNFPDITHLKFRSLDRCAPTRLSVVAS